MGAASDLRPYGLAESSKVARDIATGDQDDPEAHPDFVRAQSSPPTAATPFSDGTLIADELRKLADLRAEGGLTDEEFAGLSVCLALATVGPDVGQDLPCSALMLVKRGGPKRT